MSSRKNTTDDLMKIKHLIKKKIENHIENLCEGCLVSETDFIKVCQMLSKEQYCNITDERSLYEVCGYPLCNKHITKPSVSKQIFRITRFHTLKSCERGRFCSNGCFFSSNYLSNQLEEEPAWNLLGKPPKIIKLFHQIEAAERTCFKLTTAVGYNEKYSKDEIMDMLERKKSNLEVKGTQEVLVAENVESNVSEIHTCSDSLERVTFENDEELPNNENLRKHDQLKDQEMTRERNNEAKKTTLELTGFEKIKKIVEEWNSKMNYYQCFKRSRHFEDSSEDNVDILSIVDCSNVLALRRSIVKDRIKQAIKTLPCGLNKVASDTAILNYVNQLVECLEFSNLNVLLDNSEWKIIALALLKAFSSNDKIIETIIHSSDYDVAVRKFQMTLNKMNDISSLLIRDYKPLQEN